MPNDYTGLLSGSYWSGIEVAGQPTIVTYSFPATIPGYDAAINDPNLTPAALASFTPFSAPEQTMARTALAEWGNACGLIFIEVASGDGDINFQKLDFSGTGYDGAGGIAYRPFGAWDFATYPYFSSDLDGAGDVFMNSDIAVSYGTLLHEIGHALGLKHPTEAWTNYAANPPVTHTVWSVDDPALTIMSQLSGGTGHLTAIDQAAIQAIYGTQGQDGTQVAAWSWNTTTQTLTQSGFATADAIRGSSVKDVMSGVAGDDRLYGLNGTDSLFGGTGNDTLDGGPDNDRLVGGLGDDLYVVTGPGDLVVELLGQGYDRVFSNLSHTMEPGVEELDLFTADPATGLGNSLDNVLYGGSGANVLHGCRGDDYIVGGAQGDQLKGGAGSDVIWGGGGADQFLFTRTTDFAKPYTPDTIGDFSHAEGDVIDLAAIDPDAISPGDQAFSFVGTAAFTVDARFQLRYEVQGATTLVQIDLNRDGFADRAILLYGAVTLLAGDFAL